MAKMRAAMRVRPGIQRLPSKLAAMVDRDLLGRAMPADELVEDLRDALSGLGGSELASH